MIEVAIVGFGFSAVPLVRELDAGGVDFTIISSDARSVWDELGASDRLSFDLVSSYLTSFYSFDLVELFQKDGYPTARQFYDVHLKWRAVYQDRIVRDEVVRVDNFPDHSLIHTRSGATIEARHVVFATGFSRSILAALKNLDYQAPVRTAVFDTMGDSANLIISHLIPNGVKVIIRTNGFHARDKVVPYFATTYTLDQLEFHNYRYVSPEHYASIIYGTPAGSANPYLLADHFPQSVRDESYNRSRSRPVNGAVAIKYWPIDEYARAFGDNIEEAIESGYVLNDIAMWLHTGKAIVVPKDTTVDFERRTITYGGIERGYELYVKGDAETPRLPPIFADGVPYQYVQRETFMGVIPRALHNVYLMGFTRPYTGGLANITEMQGLFVHKLVTQPAFYERIHHNLDARIQAYNDHYYVYETPRRYEHLVYYGFYTDEMARLIGIDYRPQDCESLQDLFFYYTFPNNAFKYRLRGEYAVPGVRELISRINRQYNRFILPFAYILSSGIKEERERLEWLPGVQRNFFNDMRHKDPYRPFLATYLQAYARAKQSQVQDVPDPQWDAMVAVAAETRDPLLPRMDASPPYEVDEDIDREFQRVISWMASGTKLADFDKLQLDPARRSLIAAMRNPPEYDLPYLRD